MTLGAPNLGVGVWYLIENPQNGYEQHTLLFSYLPIAFIKDIQDINTEET